MRRHDCRVCVVNKWYKERECFLKPYAAPDISRTGWVSVPRLGPDNKVMPDPKTGVLRSENRHVNAEGFLEIIWQMNHRLPHLSAFEIHQLYFDDVCLAAFEDGVTHALIDAEGAVSQYQGAVGDLSRPAQRERLLGFAMAHRDVLEAFNTIRAAKKDYERYEYERMEAESKKNASA